MNSDCAFIIGKTHNVCQDYVICNNPKYYHKCNYIILSDGCSSAPSTDVGARILSESAKKQVMRINDYETTISNIQKDVCIENARNIVDLLSLSRESLNATLSIAYSKNNFSEVHIYGDGVAVIGLEDNSMIVISVEYEDDYPFYFSYLPTCTTRYNNWMKKHNNKTVTISKIDSNGTHFILHDNIPIGDKYIPFSNISVSPEKYIEWKHQNIQGGSLIINTGNTKDEIKYITIMSDGIHSFYESIKKETFIENVDIHYSEVIKKLLSFKNFNGQFVQRRLNKFSKNCIKNNWHHTDDISLGVIYLGG